MNLLLSLWRGTVGRLVPDACRFTPSCSHYAAEALLRRGPLLGTLLIQLESARYARTLALLGASAVPLLEALALANATVENRVLRATLAQVAARVREAARSFEAATRLDPDSPWAKMAVASIDRAKGKSRGRMARAVVGAPTV